MKLATVERNGCRRIGVVLEEGATLLDLAAAHQAVTGAVSPYFVDMLALIDGGAAALALARTYLAAPPATALLPSSAARWLAPLPEPRQIRDCLAFEDHLKNAFAQAEKLTGRPYAIPPVWYERPLYYKANRFSVIGTDQEVRWPAYSQVMDFELELACILGRTGVDIPRAAAAAYIFGFTIFNDCSARDTQFQEMAGQLGPAKGKDFDTGNVFGPWIVTADELGDPYQLQMTARVNGEVWGGGSSGAMHHCFEDIIAFISQSETLHAGEIIGSGTVGTGCGLELGRYPQPGDVVELEIERIGILRNCFVRRCRSPTGTGAALRYRDRHRARRTRGPALDRPGRHPGQRRRSVRADYSGLVRANLKDSAVDESPSPPRTLLESAGMTALDPPLFQETAELQAAMGPRAAAGGDATPKPQHACTQHRTTTVVAVPARTD